jgi:hypothetical protein
MTVSQASSTLEQAREPVQHATAVLTVAVRVVFAELNLQRQQCKMRSADWDKLLSVKTKNIVVCANSGQA